MTENTVPDGNPGTAEILAAAEQIKAGGPSKPRAGRDPVNMPMIRNWLEAIGDENPVYVDETAAVAAGHGGIVAPPAMAQVWTMRGLGAVREEDDPLGRMTQILDDAGYTSVVATNCDQIYHRYLRPGEEVTIETTLDDVVGPKKTGLGEGWFFTTRNFWRVAKDDGSTELVAEMMFRILKFRPPTDSRSDSSTGPASHSAETNVPQDLDPTRMLRPTPSRDTQFFWDGVAAHELRIQQRPDGSLQHPPVPALWKDKSETTDYVVASGRGTVFSFVVHHAPKVPGRSLPFVVALVELEEGVRMLGELRDVAPSDVTVGLPVEAEFLDFPGDDETGDEPWTLYAWRPVKES
ncbi:bifunctional MaoC family dehydratase N-terminal/OB-fold nucleic acid binding domain-containing protein [Rhodococcus sp. SGAir0479]|uniref:bifunctional MaoC family dehydratase N-terminal/OB-fold nucleic acid binding domain-containing protein n=1 Tax=Rhodococcus sp. SGAir0479 TaxID=2567884 RepID=UPI0010CCF52B|nr:bifunctional MaoC family dehydratase N-terminal/OB-fold nucleic acid binding domain-containing protein [Rhodococcus sp. SGAir0479]QCQ93615.1 DNA-binding protein [Rhodococcus sp. SGAir0479]